MSALPPILIDDLAESLQPVAAELGVPAALALVQHFGGMRVAVPVHWREGHDLNAIGEEAAKRLCAAFARDRLEVPLSAWSPAGRQRLIREMEKSGSTRSQIARALGISWRTATDGGKALLTSRPRRGSDVRQTDLEEWIATDVKRSA